ncbi:MAG: CRISPR-associated protein Cmr4 [Methanothermobacter sp.]|jgi:CRISPR-associated protein Cmr4|uniref:Type III-B CRISPR module RAMP protein Cmr4 n=1 Tax=Methanothermobacter thermautotrophicus TaxID=145262 RepID=A0A7J4MXB2_METTF|nr:type III-B CRISPR module RAMP protein Cmr4 [Methanothermobacter thermautotrophicus]MBC7119053.1 type III-B CRISPR module RAMP protein Cmr4 [Methanobacteriaceae archaeon]MDN5374645.1 CRISPR-associated protein Cmr4 [Methanothermobacter sp.]WBF08421.1 type III-B CRISPR module RAMP protein Cmr4 [Methanothermobacter thermautotrophicus]HIH65381.1 type III-B CRISPR module RAMP protein Cmr4 [Methanothermobacter thermautotrophicus]
MNRCLEPEKVYARALDPIHIGAGGYRLGRADNTIVREPSTDIPKIPGTSIAGVVRAFYTIYLAENKCKDKSIEERRKCAEKKAKSIFGDENRKGLLRFYDGQIVFFPVSSIQGTVWITTKELLKYWFEKGIEIPENENRIYTIKGVDPKKPLNLGWLLLEVESPNVKVKLPSEINGWIKRAVIVPEKLLSPIVNDNLEVRTSVRIDPETGTAVKGALFTYEAIPRGTIFGFEIAKDEQSRKEDLDKILNDISDYFECLGMGGMGTRGFGRLELDAKHKK